LEGSQRGFAIQLSGHLPADLFRDSAVMNWNRAYLGAIRGSGGYTAAEAAQILECDRPSNEIPPGEFARRLEPVVKELPTFMEGHSLLKSYIEKEVAALIERSDLIGLREERDRRRAIGMTQADVTPEGIKRSRYTAMIDREHHASLKELRALKAERRKYGEGELEESHRPERPAASESVEAEPAQQETTPVGAPAETEITAVGAPVENAPTALSERAQNEPTVSQVVDGPGGSQSAAITTVSAPAADAPTALSERAQNEPTVSQVVGGPEGSESASAAITTVSAPAKNAPTALSERAQNEPTVLQVIDGWGSSQSAALAPQVTPGGSGAIIAAEHADLEADYQRLLDTVAARLGVQFAPDGPTRNWRRE